MSYPAHIHIGVLELLSSEKRNRVAGLHVQWPLIFFLVTSLAADSADMSDRVQVFVRVRPTLPREEEDTLSPTQLHG